MHGKKGERVDVKLRKGTTVDEALFFYKKKTKNKNKKTKKNEGNSMKEWYKRRNGRAASEVERVEKQTGTKRVKRVVCAKERK